MLKVREKTQIGHQDLKVHIFESNTFHQYHIALTQNHCCLSTIITNCHQHQRNFGDKKTTAI